MSGDRSQASDDLPGYGRLVGIIVAGCLCVLVTVVAVRHVAEAYFTAPPPPDDLGPIAADSSIDLASLASPGHESDTWPNLYGPTRDGVAPVDTGAIEPWPASGPREVWRIPCGSGYGAPIVWHDRVILFQRRGDEEIVACHEVATGTVEWEHAYPTAFECGSTYTDGPYSTPTTDGDVVVTVGAEGRLHALDLTTGDVRWQHDLRAEFDVPIGTFGVGHSPLILRDRVILNVGGRSENSGIVAFDRGTGDVLWQATDDPASYASPITATVHDVEHLLVLTARGLHSLDPGDGRSRWFIPYETDLVDNHNAVSPVVHGDLLLLSIHGVGAKVVRLLPGGTFEDVWESTRTLTSHYTNIVPKGGYVYGIHTLDKTLRCVDLATGEGQWRSRSPIGRSTRVAIGESLVVLGERGRLSLVDLSPDGFVERALTTETVLDGEAVYSAPAYANGRLYLRSQTTAVCLELDRPSP